MTSTPKNIIYFDFTGTLFDPFLNIRSILNTVSTEMGFSHYDAAELDTIPKMPSIALLNAFSVPALEKKAVVKEVLTRLEEEIHTLTQYRESESYFMPYMNKIVTWVFYQAIFIPIL